MRASVFVALLVGCSSGSSASSVAPQRHVVSAATKIGASAIHVSTDGRGLLSLHSGGGSARLRWHGEAREIVEPKADGVEVSLVFAAAPREVTFDVEDGSPRAE